MRTQTCDAVMRRGRLGKAEQFLSAADTVRESAFEGDAVADAYVTLCVHSGIAAADVICCARLGLHAQGDNHTDAVALLKTAAPEVARHLHTLLGLKTKSGYSHLPVSAEDFKRAARAVEVLIDEARRANAAAG
jgi:hypothetical protein